MVDQRWRARPVTMSAETIDRTAERIAEYADQCAPSSVDVILHGGEPLLAGARRLEYCVGRLYQRIGDSTRLRISLQTNGVNLSEQFLELFRRLGVRIGVSLDGGAATHDRHRRSPSGAGSYAATTRGIRLLTAPRYRALFAGLLVTIDLDGDPESTYEAVCAFQPPMIDFLLPHGNWSVPPRGRAAGTPDAPYGEWLIRAFDRWYGAPRRETRVRLFEEIMNLLLGGRSRTEAVGLTPTAMVVIETDGAIEATDALTATYPGAAATGLHVSHDSLLLAAAHPHFASGQRGLAMLPPVCLRCRIRDVCGGGLYAHRYRRDNGFTNPSVYCPDLYRLISHVRTRLGTDVAAIRRQREASACGPVPPAAGPVPPAAGPIPPAVGPVPPVAGPVRPAAGLVAAAGSGPG